MCRDFLTRFRLLELHLERGHELRSVADGAPSLFRTLQRWVAQYQRLGLVALARKSKQVDYISGLHDKGKIVLSGPFMEKP